MSIQNHFELTRDFPSAVPEREARIQDEIIIDAGDEEIASCWYDYLEENLNFPFSAMVQTHKARNPRGGMAYCSSQMRLLSMATLERCTAHQMWAMGLVSTLGSETPIHILLTDLQSIEQDQSREEALLDWMYWNRDRNFGLWELKR